MNRFFVGILGSIASLTFAVAASAVPVKWTTASGGNGHYYEVVNTGNAISWLTSTAAVSTMFHHGTQGHLATITSAAENDFIKSLPGFASSFVSVERLETGSFLGPWIGGTRDANRDWIWVDDPLDPFADNTNVNGPGGGNPFPGKFVDWIGVEPNDGGSGGPDDYLAFLDWHVSGAGATGIGWADCPNVCLQTSRFPAESIIAYVVEYDVPEPAAVLLLAYGLLGLGAHGRRWKA